MSFTIGDASEIPRNGRKCYTVSGENVAILDVVGTLYAIRNSCPHMGGPVGEGKLSGRPPTSEHTVSRFADFSPGGSGNPRMVENAAPTIGCPWHGWEFDLADGAPRFPAKRGLKTYPVRIEDGLVVLDPGSEEPLPAGVAREEGRPATP